MSDDLGAAGVWLVIAAMAAVTYVTRIGGFVIMGYVPLTRRVRAFLSKAAARRRSRSPCRSR